MKFAKEEINIEGKPHPDVQKNITCYLKTEKRVQFDVSVRLQKIVPFKYSLEWSGMQFAFGDMGPSAMVYNLSFHQDHMAFKRELCAIFNDLGFKGLLIRLDNPKPKQEPDPWDWEKRWG